MHKVRALNSMKDVKLWVPSTASIYIYIVNLCKVIPTQLIYKQLTVSPFGIVVTVAFQSAFRLEIHRNNIFFHFLKFIFDINTSKQSENIIRRKFEAKKKIKKIKFFQKCFWNAKKFKYILTVCIMSLKGYVW